MLTQGSSQKKNEAWKPVSPLRCQVSRYVRSFPGATATGATCIGSACFEVFAPASQRREIGGVVAYTPEKRPRWKSWVQIPEGQQHNGSNSCHWCKYGG